MPADPKPSPDSTQDFVLTRPGPGSTHEFVVADTIHHPPPPPTGPALKVPLSVLNDFKLVGKLGSGGMGTVYQAVRLSTNRTVALKVLDRTLSQRPGFVERFHREARVMGRLDHPHIVKYLAAGEAHGFCYLAMELLAGGSVAERIVKQTRLSPADTATVGLAAAAALGYAHDRGFVHRDVKPDNLLVSADGVVKLADLGLAKGTDESTADAGLTRTGTGLGTPLYAPPEQVRDAKRADVRSDLYALGGVLYHAVVGRPPFDGADLLAILKKKERGTFVVPSAAAKGVPPVLDRILLKLLAKEPDHRYQTAAEVRQELEWTGLGRERLNQTGVRSEE